MNKNNILAEILYKKHMSYRALSRLSGVSKSAIDKIVKDESDPKQSTMIAIARALNMDVDEVFNLKWRK